MDSIGTSFVKFGAKETEEIIRSVTGVTDCEGKRNRGDHKERHGRDEHKFCTFENLNFSLDWIAFLLLISIYMCPKMSH